MVCSFLLVRWIGRNDRDQNSLLRLTSLVYRHASASPGCQLIGGAEEGTCGRGPVTTVGVAALARGLPIYLAAAGRGVPLVTRDDYIPQAVALWRREDLRSTARTPRTRCCRRLRRGRRHRRRRRRGRRRRRRRAPPWPPAPPASGCRGYGAWPPARRGRPSAPRRRRRAPPPPPTGLGRQARAAPTRARRPGRPLTPRRGQEGPSRRQAC